MFPHVWQDGDLLLHCCILHTLVRVFLYTTLFLLIEGHQVGFFRLGKIKKKNEVWESLCVCVYVCVYLSGWLYGNSVHGPLTCAGLSGWWPLEELPMSSSFTRGVCVRERESSCLIIMQKLWCGTSQFFCVEYVKPSETPSCSYYKRFLYHSVQKKKPNIMF